jgi:sigma-B regulation protein RsbU (phosphoserine phosphatase)
MPLGIEVDTPYQENILTFEPGDFLVCYTDGVTEANDAAGSQYGMQRLEAVIREHHTHNAEQLVESILQSVRQYTAEAAPFDDITLLVVCKT